MNRKKHSDTHHATDNPLIAAETKHKKSIWVKGCILIACLCLIIIARYLYKRSTEYNGGFQMIYTEAEIIEIFSSHSVLVKVIEDSSYNGANDPLLFHVGDEIQAEFDEEQVKNFKTDDIVIIEKWDIAEVDASQNPILAHCFKIYLKTEEDV